MGGGTTAKKLSQSHMNIEINDTKSYRDRNADFISEEPIGIGKALI